MIYQSCPKVNNLLTRKNGKVVTYFRYFENIFVYLLLFQYHFANKGPSGGILCNLQHF